MNSVISWSEVEKGGRELRGALTKRGVAGVERIGIGMARLNKDSEEWGMSVNMSVEQFVQQGVQAVADAIRSAMSGINVQRIQQGKPPLSVRIDINSNDKSQNVPARSWEVPGADATEATDTALDMTRTRVL